MIHRMGWESPPLLRWQIPELEPLPEPISRSSFVAAVCDGDGAADAGQSDADPAEPSINEMVKKHVADGYAEGWERGLAEGREKGYAEGIDSGTKSAERALAAKAERLSAILRRLSAPITASPQKMAEP